jgi:hypothetical protein
LLTFLKKMGRKRGQQKPSGTAASAVIGVIAIMLIFYILFLPPAERDALLDGEDITFVQPDNTDENNTFLSRPVGRLESFDENRVDHTVPNIVLAETQEAQILQKTNSFVVQNGWFTTKNKIIPFTINDVSNTDNTFVTFTTPSRKGKLRITLNGITVYEGTPTTANTPPVTLEKGLLQAQNNLVFSVSNTGAAFWSVNAYDISQVQIIGSVTDTTRQESINSFSIPNDEYTNIETGRLSFYPVCEQQTVGILDIVLNNKNMFSGVPVCETLNSVELLQQDLLAGKNVLTLRTSKGNYRLEQIRVRTELNEIKPFIDFFNINQEKITAIEKNKFQVNLTITFIDDNEDKTGDINLNGRFTRIDQRNSTYIQDISRFVKEGNNYVEITPDTPLNIVGIEIKGG